LAAKNFIRDMFKERPSEDDVSWMYAESLKTPTTAATTVMTDMAHADLRAVLSRIEVPALLIYGQGSKIFPHHVAEYIALQVPNAEVAIFENSGHCPFWEEPERFNAELVKFVDGVGLRAEQRTQTPV
jgi:non-heme chloroperoxidase